MHRCLAVPELLNLIFKEVHTSAKGGITVAALARTAKCFQDVALDTLWEKQMSLVPLVKCFPHEIWKETRQEDGSKQLSFVRDPNAEDWGRVKFYASRVRAMYIDPCMFMGFFSVTALAPSAYLILKNCLGAEALLPSLRTFHWANPEKQEAEDLASLLLLLNSKASNVMIQMGKWNDESIREIVSALNTFGENPSQLRSIQIKSSPCAPLEDAVLALGIRQQHLLDFKYNWNNQMSLETIAHLSGLNNLREVSIRADAERSREFFLWARERGGHFFPSLQLFSLFTDSVDVCEKWLNLIRQPDLHSLNVCVDQPPTAAAFHDFLTKLTEHPARDALHNVHFKSVQPSPRNNSLHMVRPDTLAPLLQLNISQLQLEPGAPIDIDDECVERMARAWPHLTVLELNAEWRRYAPAGLVPSVTLKGLIPLAEHCPGVGMLALPINTDVSGFEEDYEAGLRPAGGVSFKQCYMLGVGPSPIEQEADHLMIAGFLSDLCPDLMTLKTSWGRGQPMKEAGEGETSLDTESQEMGEAWRQTEKYAREMARVRRQERAWMEL
ncbi:hypothetical protein GSI_15366 [Ganoderma sinense ZZ0214-1]|uniref:F-box domain-containing protein n=1 Tax=Ganoderma sinense ZZ0214-1 TaxID=1077348 RepID=A0A2G8RMD7_9APHY|nr:hypothetical protein GSI_15366 [Ganoderma sinense ZZ0214-1]